jgi:hypothetical protein
MVGIKKMRQPDKLTTPIDTLYVTKNRTYNTELYKGDDEVMRPDFIQFYIHY